MKCSTEQVILTTDASTYTTPNDSVITMGPCPRDGQHIIVTAHLDIRDIPAIVTALNDVYNDWVVKQTH